MVEELLQLNMIIKLNIIPRKLYVIITKLYL